MFTGDPTTTIRLGLGCPPAAATKHGWEIPFSKWGWYWKKQRIPVKFSIPSGKLT